VTTDVVQGMPAASGVEYAGFWKRLAAFVIDSVIVSVIASLFAIVVPAIIGPLIGVPRGSVILAGGATLWLAVGWLYSALLESSSRQSTVGKSVWDMLVTGVEGNRITFGRASVRYLGKIASALIFFVGFIMIGFTANKQALHDRIVRSAVVVKEDPLLSLATRYYPNGAL
jgi:uncharacterized RDD family membrane protein YckC